MKRLCFALTCAFILFGPDAHGWWPKGHGLLTRAAVNALPEEVPAFFRSGATAIAHYAFDPDVSKNKGPPSFEGPSSPNTLLTLNI